ncbi:MAG: tRNA (adenosine(37)-N6)-threonylcarbamoyltransferase complex dimerization subunit type 1 TsaB [Deltaproteobacteria bacterium]|nr:tRNA (adenosine(37)-N6)-threonylcarbamoyltransferase complex dimerization subunit type 1 TsaB [Deltaproteobacteria bacterium]
MILAFETSGRPGSVAIAEKEDVREQVLEGDASELRDACARLLGSELSQVAGYAISIGPGSFTGLRVGVSFLKGLAFVHPRPVAAVSSLEVLAYGLMTDAEASRPKTVHAESGALALERFREVGARILSVVDARRGSVFAALYRVAGEGRLLADEMLVEGLYRVEAVSRLTQSLPLVIAVGDGALLVDARSVSAMAPPSRWIGRAAVLAKLGTSYLAAGLGVEADTLEPVYHQVSGAEEKLGMPPG